MTSSTAVANAHRPATPPASGRRGDDPRAIDKLIDDAVANQRALWDTEDKRLTQLRKILTPAQTARVLIVLPTMERKIQNQLRKAVERRTKESRDEFVDPFSSPRGRGAPTFDDDDRLPDENPRPRKNAAPPTRVPPNKVCDPFTALHGCK